LVEQPAIAFGAAGAKVVFSDIRSVEGEETADLIRETGAECLFVKSDVSSEADVRIVQKRSPPTANSIVPLTMLELILLLPLHEQSIEDFDKIMSINARGLSVYEIRNSTDANPRRRRDREQFINEWSVAKISPIASKHVMGLTRSALSIMPNRAFGSMSSSIRVTSLSS